MGQGIGGVPEAPGVGESASPGREPIGRYISQQRRLRGIELDEIALRTRIPRRSLERLGYYWRRSGGTLAEAATDRSLAILRSQLAPVRSWHEFVETRLVLDVDGRIPADVRESPQGAVPGPGIADSLRSWNHIGVLTTGQRLYIYRGAARPRKISSAPLPHNNVTTILPVAQH